MPDQERSDIEPAAQRLEGEPEAPVSAEETQAWVRMYAQLVEFEEGILEKMRALQADLPDVLRQEVEASNIQPMEDLIAAYRDRVEGLTQRMVSVVPDEEVDASPT